MWKNSNKGFIKKNKKTILIMWYVMSKSHLSTMCINESIKIALSSTYKFSVFWFEWGGTHFSG